MPELPEVETTKRGLLRLCGLTAEKITVHQPQLRYPVDKFITKKLPGRPCNRLLRSGKHLLMDFNQLWLVWHLGMSGSMRLENEDKAIRKHDHLIIKFSNKLELRYNDPRRFGYMLLCEHDPQQLPQLQRQGPEPLGDEFTADYLYRTSRNRSITIKQLIMTPATVTGVGNIYANESLFRAGIHPQLSAAKLTLKQAQRLVEAIKESLTLAIQQGGTTLRDFVNSDGKPGYFQQSLLVYGRKGQACTVCGNTLQRIVLNGRATVYCPKCQRKTG